MNEKSYIKQILTIKEYKNTLHSFLEEEKIDRPKKKSRYFVDLLQNAIQTNDLDSLIKIWKEYEILYFKFLDFDKQKTADLMKSDMFKAFLVECYKNKKMEKVNIFFQTMGTYILTSKNEWIDWLEFPLVKNPSEHKVFGIYFTRLWFDNFFLSMFNFFMQVVRSVMSYDSDLENYFSLDMHLESCINQITTKEENLDIYFNAGGQMSVGLTSTMLVSQWTWAATLLKSTEVCVNMGLSGPFWYAAGATIQLILFSIVSVQLKIRAPGAKTFLQVIRARFGKRTHITFCVFALMTNVIVSSMLMVGGSAVLMNLVQNQSLELSIILICSLVGGMTLTGGLGANFYVSYFTTSVMFIIIIIFAIQVFHSSNKDYKMFGDISQMYTYLVCLNGPATNSDMNYLTMISQSGFMFGIINIIGNFGTVFVDQAFWQCSVAAKPRQGMWGFIFGGLVWFAIPFTFATSIGFAYLIMNSQYASPILSSDQIQSGLVPPTVANLLLGFAGEILLILIIILAVTSTAASEVMAVTSILIYDVYAIYINPYRKTFDANTCLLCGKMRGRMANPRDKCICESMTFCESCIDDDRIRVSNKRSINRPHICKIHGQYRDFLDHINHVKNWCVLIVCLSLIPLTVIVDLLQVNLGWIYNFMGILIGSAIPSVLLTMFWAKLTGLAAMSGSIAGTFCGIISWLIYGSFFKNGLNSFLKNTGESSVMLLGNCISIGVGSLITIFMSLIQSRNLSDNEITEIWDNTRDIDNPLAPWPETYAKELKLTGAHCLDKRPSLEEVQRGFRMETVWAILLSIAITVILIIICPVIMIGIGTLTNSEFVAWIYMMDTWVIVAAVYIIIAPIANEIYDIHTKLKRNRVMDELTQLNGHT